MCCGGFIGDVWDAATGLVEGVVDIAGDIVEGVGDVIGDVAEGIGDVVEDVGDFVFDALDSVTDTIDNLMENPTALISVGLSLAVPGIGSMIGSALGATGTAATVLGNSIMNGVMSEASGGDFIEGAFASAVTGGFGSYAGDVGAVLGIEDAALAKTVGNAVTKAGSAAVLGKDVAGTFLETAIVDGITTGAFKSSTTGAPDITPDNIDIGGGWSPAGPDMTPDNIDVGGGWSPAGIEPIDLPPVFDATEREGTLAKPTPATTPDIGFKDVAKALIGAGSAGATAAVTKSVVKKQAPMIDVQYKELKGKELYKDAPLAGYQMVKMTNDQGAVKYIPFINNRPQLKVPAGFKPAEMAQGGFVKRRV